MDGRGGITRDHIQQQHQQQQQPKPQPLLPPPGQWSQERRRQQQQQQPRQQQSNPQQQGNPCQHNRFIMEESPQCQACGGCSCGGFSQPSELQNMCGAGLLPTTASRQPQPFPSAQQAAHMMHSSIEADFTKPPPGIVVGEDISRFVDPAAYSAAPEVPPQCMLSLAPDDMQLARRMNPGSIGHPELCMQPCTFITNGGCNNGANCGYCHMPHKKRPLHFDKRNRELLREMPYDEVFSLVFPLMHQKIDEVGLLEASEELFEQLAAPPVNNAVYTVGQRAVQKQVLSKTLSSMSFSGLVTLLASRSDGPPSVLNGRAKMAFARLRSRLAIYQDYDISGGFPLGQVTTSLQ
jgi:hypothetical protein